MLENVKALHRVTTESSILWKTVCWLLPGLDFIPNKFDRQGVARMRPFSFPNVIDARLVNAAAELVDPGSCGFSAEKVSPSKLGVAADPREGHRFLNFGSEGQSNRAGHHSRGIALEPSLSAAAFSCPPAHAMMRRTTLNWTQLFQLMELSVRVRVPESLESKTGETRW